MPLPTQPQNNNPTLAERVNSQVKQGFHQYARQSMRMLDQSITAIFGQDVTNINPTQVADNLAELGDQGGNVFSTLNAIKTHLESLLAGTQYEDEITAIAARVANLPAFTITNGVVTLD